MARLFGAAPRPFHGTWLTPIRVMKSITPKGSTPRQPGGSIGSEDPPHYLRIPNGTFTIFDRVSGAHAVAVPPRWGGHIPNHS